MQDVEAFFGSPDGTRGEMMLATYRALCTHGYADLTVERIGEEFPKSKSLIYHHYDGKDELLLEFISFMLERYEAAMPVRDAAGPDEHLEMLLDAVFVTPVPEDRREFTGAMVELRAQAAHDADYRALFTRHDRFFADRLAAVLAAGVEDGTFRDVDPEAVAAFVLVVINGAMTQQVTSETDVAATIRDQLEAYLEAVLLPED